MYHSVKPGQGFKEIMEMRKIEITVVLLTGALLLSGCSSFGKRKYGRSYNLPLGTSMYESYYDEDFGEMSLDFFGKNYTQFGWTDEYVPDDEIEKCIGYCDHNEDMRVYYLKDDPDHNYVMVVNLNSIKGDWSFYRDQDTVNRDIFTPDYIESNGYECWGSSGVHCSDAKEPASIALKVKCDYVKSVNCNVTVNGGKTFRYEAASDSGKVITKGDFVYMKILPEELDGIDTDKPFSMEVTFTVTDGSGNEHPVEGSYSHDMMLGAYLFNIDIEYDDAGGYYAASCI